MPDRRSQSHALCCSLIILATALLAPTASAIVIRHDRDDARYVELGKQFPAAATVLPDGSGVLIAPDWVLTAAHVARGVASRSPRIEVAGQERQVSRILVHNDWKEMGPHDIALLQLSRPIEEVTPATLYSGADEVDQVVTFVGRGDTGTGLTGPRSVDRQRRGATNTIVEADDDWIFFVFDEGDEATDLEGVSGPGDSGGPALSMRDGKLYTLGVSVFADGEGGPGRYGVREGYTRVSTHREWIESVLAGRGAAREIVPGMTRQNGAEPRRKVVKRGPGSGSPSKAGANIQGYFAALNEGDFEAMQSFYESGVTQSFRTRRTEEEDRELFERLRDDMGRVEVQMMKRSSPEEVHVTARAERVGEPVQFTFRIENDRIDGFSVEIGGPGPGEGDSMALELPDGADDETLGQALDRELKLLAKDDAFSGVVLLARNGEPMFHKAYGMADRAAGRQNDTDTQFDVGSITKLLTKVGVAQLMQSGKLKPSDTILDLIPDYPNREIAAKITVQHLIDHKSGLGDIFNDRWEATPKDSLQSPKDFFPIFADMPLQFEPGQGRSYSNAGFIVLGAMVEAASGKPYATYLDENVFRPAGMRRSGFPSRDGTATELAIGYTRHGEESDDLRPNLGMLPIRGCPAGSSSHTAEDLLRLDQALRAGRLLNPEWTAWVYTGSRTSSAKPGEVDYPLGVAGGGPGVNAGFESDGATTAIVLSNLDPPGAERLAIQLYRALN